MQCGTLDWILEQKKDIDGKLVESKLGSLDNGIIVPMLIFGFDHCTMIIQDANIRRRSWEKGIQELCTILMTFL